MCSRQASRLAFRAGLSRLVRWANFNSTLAIVIARAKIHGSFLIQAPRPEALLPAPDGVGRFVIRATHEPGVGVPSSRSLATAAREASESLSEATDGACVTVHATTKEPF